MAAVVRPIIMNYDDILTHRPRQPRQSQAGGRTEHRPGTTGIAGGEGGAWSLVAPETAGLMQTV